MPICIVLWVVTLRYVPLSLPILLPQLVLLFFLDFFYFMAVVAKQK